MKHIKTFEQFVEFGGQMGDIPKAVSMEDGMSKVGVDHENGIGVKEMEEEEVAEKDKINNRRLFRKVKEKL
jgi:hypothetical protein